MRRCLVFGLALLPVFAQLPQSATLSESDRPLFRAEIDRVEKSLNSASDKSTLSYQMARTWASAKQWSETIEWLQKTAALNVGLDPSRDPLFVDLRATREFAAILETVRQATPPVAHSKPAFKIQERDLVPESLAYDPAGKHFYFGTMTKGKVLRCAISGVCTQFATGLNTVLGMKVRGGALWLLNNSSADSALIQYNVASGAIVRKYQVSGSGHLLNDLAFSPEGEVYMTDTRAGAVWHLDVNAANLEKLSGEFQAANGIAVSSDGRFLYVSTFPDGITIFDFKTHAATPLSHPANLCLAYVEGLYFHRGALIAIQNGFMTPRVVRMNLSRDLTSITHFDVLERRNPLFAGITTGVVIGHELFYMANVQDDKKSGFTPITILKVGL
jgi:SMP-30/Gluconolactonase/LRE-like region